MTRTLLATLVLAGCGPGYSADGYWEGFCSSSDSYPDILVLDILEGKGGDLLADVSLSHTGFYYPDEPATEMFTLIASGTREGADVSLEFELEEAYWGGSAATYSGTINEDRILVGAWGFRYDKNDFSFTCRSMRADKP